MSRFTLVVALLLIGTITTTSIEAQNVRGVVRSTDGQPVGYASVIVSTQSQDVRADRAGVFRLKLNRGQHTITARRIGFLASTIVLKVVDTSISDSVAITLKPNPNELRGLVVKGDRENQFAMTTTSETLRNAPPLGEPDVFRTLPLLPSISQPNDLTNAIHLGGGASDEHAITLDGFPLQSPFHFGNILGAFNVAALDRANVSIHHIPALRDGYLSGEIALESKRAGARASNDVSITLLSASATSSVPLPLGLDLLVSGRATYIDKVLANLKGQSSSNDLEIPRYQDALVQLKRDRNSGWSWNATGYLNHDAAHDSHSAPGEHPLSMGESLLGVHVSRRGLNWNGGLRLSYDRNTVLSSTVYQSATDTAPHLETNRIDQRWTTGEFDIERLTSSWIVRGGATVRLRDHRFKWVEDFIDEAINTPVPAPIDAKQTQVRVGIGGEASRVINDWWNLTVGSHVSVVDGKAFVAPRLLISRPLGARMGFSVAVDRRYQFDAIAGDPQETSVPQPSFLLSRPRAADGIAVSLSGEGASSTRAFSVNANSTLYARRYRDQTYLPPLTAAGRDSQPANMQTPAFARVPGYVLGAGLSLQLSTRRGDVAQISYTRQRTRIRVGGEYAPPDWDARNQVSTFASIALARHLTFNTVFQMHTGPATTPVNMRITVPTYFGYMQRYIYGSPNSANFPGYQRLDLGLKYNWRMRRSEWGVSLQAVNTLFRQNGIRYYLPLYLECIEQKIGCDDRGVAIKSLPVIPSLGIEVKW